MIEIIRAKVTGDNYVCEGNRIGSLPALCRKLVEAGHDPASRLEVWRGDMLCLKVRSIGEAAGLRITPHSVGFVRLPECTGASPVRTALGAGSSRTGLYPTRVGGAAMTGRANRACSTNRRGRAEMAAIRDAIIEVLRVDHPQTVRQVFYQLVTRGIIEKTEAEYQTTVIRLLTEMRLNEQVDWDWIVDESRRVRITQTFDGIADAARHTARFYRRSALEACPDHIQIWIEKEALAGIIWRPPANATFPLFPARGCLH